MIVGFTGTQDGMTKRQVELLTQFFIEFDVSELHHGDCIGADDQAGRIAKGLGVKVVSHPPVKASKRAYSPADVVLTPQPYRVRNTDIVLCSELLIVCPKQMTEVLRSGTWMTKRIAERVGRQIVVITPLGVISVARQGGPSLRKI